MYVAKIFGKANTLTHLFKIHLLQSFLLSNSEAFRSHCSCFTVFSTIWQSLLLVLVEYEGGGTDKTMQDRCTHVHTWKDATKELTLVTSIVEDCCRGNIKWSAYYKYFNISKETNFNCSYLSVFLYHQLPFQDLMWCLLILWYCRCNYDNYLYQNKLHAGRIHHTLSTWWVGSGSSNWCSLIF